MMNSLTAVYKILTTLEKRNGLSRVDMSQIDRIALGVRRDRWSR